MPDAGQLGELLAGWRRHLRAENRALRTIVSYLEAGEQLSAFLAAAGLPTAAGAIRREHVEAYLEQVLDEHSPATAANRYRSLQQLFRWLVEEGASPGSPFERMRAPQVPDRPVPILTVDQQHRLLATCTSASFADRRDQAILLVLLDTGARLAELAGLRHPDDVELEGALLTVLGKGRRPRALPRPPPARWTDTCRYAGNTCMPRRPACGWAGADRWRSPGSRRCSGGAPARPGSRACTRTGSGTPSPTPGSPRAAAKGT